MMKRIMSVMVILLFLVGSAGAATLIDTQPADLMSIDDAFYDNAEEITFVYETYADNDLIPYPSHDGYAVVHDFGSGYRQYFDKYVYPQTEDINSGFVDLLFNVNNDSVRSWSGYHFEFWDLAFQNRLTVTDLFISNGWFEHEDTILYTDGYGTGSIATCWTENGSLIDPGMYDNWFYLSIDLAANPGLAGGFAIRQVATTVPIPGAVWLLGSGLLGLVGLRRKTR